MVQCSLTRSLFHVLKLPLVWSSWITVVCISDVPLYLLILYRETCMSLLEVSNYFHIVKDIIAAFNEVTRIKDTQQMTN